MALVEMFSRPQCAYCVQAKSFLEQKGVAYKEYDVSQAKHRQEFFNRLPRVKALPQIFINGEHIGSYEDLTVLDGDGRLQEMLQGVRPQVILKG